MRYEVAKQILELARALASNAEGMTLEQMCAVTGQERRKVERMRDTIRELFPQMEEVSDHPTKRFRIPKGLDGFCQVPTTNELSDLGVAIAELRDRGAIGRAESLAALERKIRAALPQKGKRATEIDVEALVRAELIAVQAGPRPTEDPKLLVALRDALLAMKQLRFVYHGGSKPGTSRDVIPYGIIFGRMNYLIGADVGTIKPKHWRLDRIANLEQLEASGQPPADFDLITFANTSFGYFEGPQENVVLHVLPHGMEDFSNFRFHSSQVEERHPSGGVLVRFRASGMRELAAHLFTWQNKVEIIEPVSLRELMTTELRVALAHHEEPLRFAYTVPTPKET